jgi:hypothetical protein
MTVTKANEAAATLVGTTATLAVDTKTRVKWEGVGLLTGPNAGDRLNVVAKQCAATATTLTAWKVDARAARSDEKKKAEAAKPAATPSK